MTVREAYARLSRLGHELSLVKARGGSMAEIRRLEAERDSARVAWESARLKADRAAAA